MTTIPANYFFVDGSALISDITFLQRKRSGFKQKKLSVVDFAEYFSSGTYRFTGGGYRRFVLYFVNNEDRIKDCFWIPNFGNPDEVDDLQIKYCGKRVPGGKAVDDWIQKNNPPKSVRDRLHRTEKAVDTQICCDALQLSVIGRLDRLFLYTNDYDFLPLCNALKAAGSNVSLFRLFKENTNKDLVSNCDSFTIVTPEKLPNLFK